MKRIVSMLMAILLLAVGFPMESLAVDAAVMEDGSEAEVELNGHVYRIYDEGMEWIQAKEQCEEMGGHLATITSAEEQAVIVELLSSGTKNSYWIGGYKEDDIWKWLTGEEFSYTKWLYA